jgi:hypothetical protein
MTKIHTSKQPRQRLPYSKKTKPWRKENLDFANKYSFYHNEGVRQTLKNKVVNLNLFNGIVDVRDMAQVVNPYNMDASYIPDNIPHHPIVVPKIDLLVGEETKRRFDFKVLVTNPDAISAKEEAKKQFLMAKFTEYLKANYEKEELEKKLDELNDYLKYTWQDLREKMATQILKHYSKEQDFASIFNDGFKDALIMAEEIYQVDIEHNEPVIRKLNPLKVRAVRSGKSDRIEDSSLIIIEDHWSPSKIVDVFHDELKPSDIDEILEYTTSSSRGSYSEDDDNHVLLRDAVGEGGEPFMDSLFEMAELNGHVFGHNYTDEEGNIRVLQVYWKSLKKVKKVKYFDEDGEQQTKIMSEEYILDKNRGETEEVLWINEMWEGTMIGKDIYLKMRPRPIQYNKVNNPSYCHAGIIGQIYNTNQGRAVSLLDRCKNYQYLYDSIWDRLNKAIATNYGKIFELDISKIPDNWEVDKWMHFAVVNKIAVIDSFKEGNHGAATGKLAGSMNTQGGRAIDMETGNYIQQHIQLLEFIKMEMGEISGVSQQRQGQIENRETVGGVERSVAQSSHVTEYWFSKHEKLKLRVLTAFLETAKVALRGNNKKVQYILDDLSIEMLNLDGETFSEADYGLVLTSSNKTMEMEQAMKQHAQAFLQNGGSLSTIMDIYFSESISDMRRKLETAEAKIQQQQSKSAEDQNKLAQQAQADAKELEQTKLQLEEAKNIRDNETKLAIKRMDLENSAMQDSDPDDGIADEKLQLDIQKRKDDLLLKIRDLDDKMKMHEDKMKREDKKIAASKQSKPNS